MLTKLLWKKEDPGKTTQKLIKDEESNNKKKTPIFGCNRELIDANEIAYHVVSENTLNNKN